MLDYSYLVSDNSKHKKAKGVNRNVMNITFCLMFCSIKYVRDIWWIGFEVKIINKEPVTRFLSLALMIKYAFKIMDVMDSLALGH